MAYSSQGSQTGLLNFCNWLAAGSGAGWTRSSFKIVEVSGIKPVTSWSDTLTPKPVTPPVHYNQFEFVRLPLRVSEDDVLKEWNSFSM